MASERRPAHALTQLQDLTWHGSLPLEIVLSPADCRSYDQTSPYMIQAPRLSYLPFLLPRLHAFFVQALVDPSVSLVDAWLSFDSLPLKWHHPLGLLYDLFAQATPIQTPGEDNGNARPRTPAEERLASLPWRLTLHYSSFPSDQLIRMDPELQVLHDAYINSVKEADFLRNGTAKAIMTLSKDHSTQLWEAVRRHQAESFHGIYTRLLPPLASLRHVPLRVYLPTANSAEQSADRKSGEEPAPSKPVPAAHLKVVQCLVPAMSIGTREPQKLGMALQAILPDLFPSRRTPVLARPVLHGVIISMSATLDDLMRYAAYADGWLNFSVDIMG